MIWELMTPWKVDKVLNLHVKTKLTIKKNILQFDNPKTNMQ